MAAAAETIIDVESDDTNSVEMDEKHSDTVAMASSKEKEGQEDEKEDKKDKKKDKKKKNKEHHHHHHHHHHREIKNRPTGHRTKDLHYKLYKTPKEATIALIQASSRKVSYAMDKYLYLSVAAGLYVGIGGLFALVVGLPVTNPGLQKLIIGLTFPIALALIVFLGGELFTGNTMYFTMGVLHRQVGWYSAIFSLIVSYIGNYMGTQFAAFLFGWVTDFFVDDPWHTGLLHLAEKKCDMNWGVILVRAIPANFLVCSAIYLYATAEDVTGKILGMWLPIATFAATGFEHCIANMFYVPLGIMYGADCNYGKFLYNNLLPATIGNFIGGAIFLGTMLWYIYCFREDRVIERPPKPDNFRFKRWTVFKKRMLPPT